MILQNIIFNLNTDAQWGRTYFNPLRSRNSPLILYFLTVLKDELLDLFDKHFISNSQKMKIDKMIVKLL